MKVTLFVLLICFSDVFCQNHIASDLTAENLFSENIEGPCFQNGILYVVNYKTNGTIGAVKHDGTTELFVTLPEGSIANAIQFDKKGHMLLADFKAHNILKVDMKSRTVSVFVHNESFNQPNDICVNKKGQLFASDPNWKEGTGKLWRIEVDGSSAMLKENMGTTNGIALSPSEEILYVNETAQRKIWRFDLDARGEVTNQKLFASFDDFGLDGMKCDHEGNLYVTRHGKGTVVIFSPKGEILHEVKMKGLKPSNLNFGGPDGKTCYVTMQDRKCVEIFRIATVGIK